ICVQVTERIRACPILCLTNDKVRQINAAVKFECPGINIHKYTDDNEHLPTKVVGPKNAIFSTNYAGRGTDIKPAQNLKPTSSATAGIWPGRTSQLDDVIGSEEEHGEGDDWAQMIRQEPVEHALDSAVISSAKARMT
uniref:Ski_Sno domain-containing protein n=1 Tax=Globodera pallida TaxID=36090 RepID=A0A183CPS9_GLOPA